MFGAWQVHSDIYDGNVLRFISKKWYELIYIVLKDHYLLHESNLEGSMDRTEVS